MTKSGITIKALASLVFAFALCSAAQAQQRTFVSGTGSDANPCTRTSPCRNFQRGHDAVAANGEVVALDSAGYGPVTINRSVTITGEGVMAGITAASGNGITIATASITVNLRSLSIQGNGSGTHGINATEFTVLHIENCIVNGFTGQGILAQPSAAGTRKVFIKDSISRSNGNGIFLDNVSGTALIATVEGTRTENNAGEGIFIRGSGATATARGCLASGNSGNGFYSDVGVLNIESSVASNNSLDGIVTTGGTVRVSTSTVTNNTGSGFNNIGGTFESRENNTVRGNAAGDISGTITPLTAL